MANLLQRACQQLLAAARRVRTRHGRCTPASDAGREAGRGWDGKPTLSTRATEATEVFGDRVSMLAGLLPQFTWSEAELPEGVRIELRGPLTIEEAPALWMRLSELLENSAGKTRVQIDNSGVTAIDGACTALLVHLRSELKSRGVHCEFTGGSPAVRQLVDLYGGRRRPKPRRARRAASAVEQVGRTTVAMFDELLAVLDFFGRLVRAVWFSLRHPRQINFRDIGLTMERAGADAAPIVMLINFLIGFVMAYQSALQLKQFGANIYVADLVGLSMTRELGPLMTAIIVCGRTGAAFAAELGSMKVNEEIDALSTMGFRPMRFLVLPRTLALLLVLPLLTIMADAVGMIGGLVVGRLSLDVSVTAYITETRKAVALWDIFSGVLKSGAFALAI